MDTTRLVKWVFIFILFKNFWNNFLKKLLRRFWKAWQKPGWDALCGGKHFGKINLWENFLKDRFVEIMLKRGFEKIEREIIFDEKFSQNNFLVWSFKLCKVSIEKNADDRTNLFKKIATG